MRTHHLIKKLLYFSLVFILSWCWDSTSETSNYTINSEGLTLKYNWNIKLEKVLLKNSDPKDIIDIYQENNNTDYKDSLIIAKWFNKWDWVNLFVQNNLDTLEHQWLTITNIKKKQLSKTINNNSYNSVLVEYEIVDWFISSVPKLYISQLFIDIQPDFLVYSYITESESQRSSISKSFKNIK